MISVDKAMINYYESEIQKSYREWDKAAEAGYERTESAKRNPKPRYTKGDTTAASARLLQLLQKERQVPPPPRRLALKVDQSLILSLDKQAEKASRFQAVIEGVLAKPMHPAKRRECRTPRMPIPGPVVLKDTDMSAWETTPTIMAVAAVTGCRWPIGDPCNGAFKFCNKKRILGSFYCEAHERKARE